MTTSVIQKFWKKKQKYKYQLENWELHYQLIRLWHWNAVRCTFGEFRPTPKHVRSPKNASCRNYQSLICSKKLLNIPEKRERLKNRCSHITSFHDVRTISTTKSFEFIFEVLWICNLDLYYFSLHTFFRTTLNELKKWTQRIFKKLSSIHDHIYSFYVNFWTERQWNVSKCKMHERGVISRTTRRAE